MLKAGFSKIVISPDYPMVLGGYAARNGYSLGVHDDLYVKACSINDSGGRAMILVCDLLVLMYEHYENIKNYCIEKHGIDDVIVCTTHTHSGPETRKSYDSASVNSVWCENMILVVKSCIDSAIRNEEPTQIRYNKKHVPEVARNRRKGETLIDDELNLLVFESMGHEILGLFMNYACHCTVLDSSNYFVSADYPQYIYQRLEKEFPKATVMFTNGACGNINIGYSADDSALGVDMKAIRSFENAKIKAEYISDAAISLISHAQLLDSVVKAYKLSMEYPVKEHLPSVGDLEKHMENLQTKIQYSDDYSEKQQIEIQCIYDECLLNNIIDFDVANKKTISAECTLLAIGDVILMSFPGEMFCEIGMQLKKIVSKKSNLIIIGYANGYYGYFPTEKAHIAGGYECETSVNDLHFEQYITGRFEEFEKHL